MSSTPAPISPSTRAVARWVMGLSWLNLAALGVLCWLLFAVSESWWVSTVLTYAPRTPFAAPALGLLVASLFWHRPSLWLNAVSLAVVLGPVMGLSLPTSRLLSPSVVETGELELKIVSCNVQAFKPDFAKVLDEIAAINPDVVAFQEAFPLSPLLDEAFRGWHTVNHDRFWVGSRYPLKIIAKCDIDIFDRAAGLIVELETPSGPVVLGNIHPMTVRWGISELNAGSLVTGEGPHALAAYELRREAERAGIRGFVDSARGDKALLVVGDFNSPTSSPMFQRHWSDMQSAFDLAGVGYGYTYPSKRSRYWPENLPWVRIDHILCSPEWTVRSCQIGQSTGSDHRLIAAKLRLTVPAAVVTEDTVAGLR